MTCETAFKGLAGFTKMQDSATDYGHIAAGSPVSAQRRMLEMRLKEARERLNAETGTRPAFEIELTSEFARRKLRIFLFTPALLVAAGGAGSLFIQAIPLAFWLGLAFAAQLAMLLACRLFLRSETQSQKVRQWRRNFYLLEGLQGLSWAALPFLPLAQESASTSIYLFAATLVVLGAGTLTSSSLPIAVITGTAPVAVSLIVCFLLKAEPVWQVLAGVAACAQIYSIVLARRYHLQALEILATRLEKDGLIAELEQAKATSDEARRRAEAANLAKSRFLATMSHELRTPLNAILGFSEVMKNEILGPLANATYKDYADDIHKSGQHLLNLINEILDLSRIEAGKFELNEESVNLVGTVEDSVRLLKLRAQSRGINLQETYEEHMANLWADERAIRQITLNLLSNAIKFTPAEGSIFVKAGWTAGGGQYVSVRDTGPGIPDDEISIVLASFGQGSNALKTAEQGAGLGLPIVKGLVDLHGGTFTFKSKLRVGTEVIITFPPERVMEALPPVKDKASKKAG